MIRDYEDVSVFPLDALPVEFLFSLTAHTGDRAPVVLPAPGGTRVVVTAMRGDFVGPRISGTVADVAGGDWVTARPDGSMKLDVRLVLRTSDGADILMTYSGIGVRGDDGTTTVRAAPLFETGDERYTWLNGVQGAAHGTAGPGSVRYDVYALT